MASKPLLIDTNVWVSLYQPQDPLHPQTKSIFRSGDLESYRLTITNYILLESVTVLSLHVGLTIAKTAASFLTHPTNLDHLQVTEKLDRQALKIMFAETSKNLSFVDASLLAILQAHPHTTLLSFDQQLCRLAQKQGHSIWPPTSP